MAGGSRIPRTCVPVSLTAGDAKRVSISQREKESTLSSLGFRKIFREFLFRCAKFIELKLGY